MFKARMCVGQHTRYVSQDFPRRSHAFSSMEIGVVPRRILDRFCSPISERGYEVAEHVALV